MQLFDSETDDAIPSASPTPVFNSSDSSPRQSDAETMNRLPKRAPKSNPSQGFAPVLKNPRFLILWAGGIFSQLADKFYLVLMISLIATHYQEADQSISGWVSAIMIANTIPAVLVGSVAGVYVDRWLKKQVLVISNLLRGAFVLVIPLLLWLVREQTLAVPLGWLPDGLRNWHYRLQGEFNLPFGFFLLLVITFLVSTLTQFFAPAEQSTLPLVVKRRHLLPANSLNTLTTMAVLIIGFAIGEPLLAFADSIFGTRAGQFDIGKVMIVGTFYIIAGLILIILRTNEKYVIPTAEQPHVWEDIRDGIRYLNKNHKVRNALIQLVILFCIFAALSVLAVSMAEKLPGLKASQFGFLLASCGAGMAVSAITLGYWGQKFSHTQLSLWGSLGMAAALIGLSLATKSLILAFAMTALLGIFAALVGVPMQTTLQADTPPEMRGKVFGLENNAVNIALSLPLAVAGIAETQFGLRPVLLALAVMAVIGGGFTWYVSGNLSKD
ncbi:MFS transporter [Microcystis aeruginosa]|uniref:MFS transporter n=1 Tax=Microcystis aeruginosa Ma_QC_C_20070703_M131 TaxID=2486263 RepID=A0A551YHD9_MICAE|nr:MFS transporter [Microcystis aeruginosa]MDB9391918.1 MFS transporter [Microcystis aeruginosa CS-579]TRT60388.1 MAG: MFS transporter [Microcystis aeruginosa Ma_QC_C_20070703_M131]